MSERPRRGAVHEHRAPADCPVCGDRLAVTRLGCGSCGTELAGVFTSCAFCALDASETEMLNVFLASRGNLRDLEKHLGVSYPTARLRFNQLLEKLGLAEPPAAPTALTREQVLAEVASGALGPEEAAALLADL
ncbi:DUF2089 domain-containing protein [Microlunatus capsulatus]|uniref:DUF2089 domain-containing protein n=1 Tax=Microlunatus capsulatus TaxID=99117 RepID=A0ABS4ZAR9_9ACTN|nr:DUF2089 domain-containing protein [Microlunatus capsulatus]MBP2418141.1 hypothetical protein [Microlunatus capsulatus]